MGYTKRLRTPLLNKQGGYILGIDRAVIPATQVCIGIDPSLSGHAIAVLCDGELDYVSGWTTKKGLQKRNPKTLNYLKMPKGRTEANSQARMALLAQWTFRIIGDYAFKLRNSDVKVAIEGYAFSKRSKGLHEIHGLVEMIKQGLFAKGIPFRVYDPLSIKLAWTGYGHSDKEHMKKACKKYYAEGFEGEESAGENLADAVLIAGLLHMELEIKAGRAHLDKVDENVRKVMLRTTKSEPIAIISRDFVTPEVASLTDPILGTVRGLLTE